MMANTIGFVLLRLQKSPYSIHSIINQKADSSAPFNRSKPNYLMNYALRRKKFAHQNIWIRRARGTRLLVSIAMMKRKLLLPKQIDTISLRFCSNTYDIHELVKSVSSIFIGLEIILLSRI